MDDAANKPSITLAELSKLTGIARRALWRCVRAGTLPAFRAKGSRVWRVWVPSDGFDRLFESTELQQPEQPAEEVNACHS